MTADNSRLLEFGDQLRQLRKRAGLTGTGVAELTGWQASKVSRLETGQQLISEQDLGTWCRVVSVDDADQRALFDELRGVRLDQARWKSRVRTGHRPVQQAFGENEQAATRIRSFENVLIPGLVQTPDYARAVFTAMAELHQAPDDIEDAVAERSRRQAVLYDSTKRVEMIVSEAALRTPFGGPGVMAGQIDRLFAVLGLQTVRFGVIPLDQQPRLPAMHGFWILDDLVTIEVTNTEIATRDPEDVEVYARLFDSLWEQTVEGDDLRAVLTDAVNHTRA